MPGDAILEIGGGTDIVLLLRRRVEDVDKSSHNQKGPSKRRGLKGGGEYRSRTGDLLHAMQAL